MPAQKASNAESFSISWHRQPNKDWNYTESTLNRPESQIPLCTCSISHNAPFRTEMCTFLWYGTDALWDLQIRSIVMEHIKYTHLSQGPLLLTQYIWGWGFGKWFWSSSYATESCLNLCTCVRSLFHPFHSLSEGGPRLTLICLKK